VRAGEKIVLCGPSGSGKSTLIRCINHIEKHDAGRIMVDGVELTDRMADINSIRREIGMVFQSFNLFPHLSVAENCMLAPMKVRGLSRPEARERARRSPQGAHPRSGGEISGTALRRPAAARRHRARPLHETEDHAVRRADPRSIPRWSRRCSISWSSSRATE
jgi:glutamate/aspartate transport system ATP-binding protein